MFEKFIDIILNILSIFIGDSLLEKINEFLSEKFRDKKFRILCFASIFLMIILIVAFIYKSSISVTKVIISNDTLIMNVDDTQTLTATVLYSNNSTDNSVIWTSSDESIAKIDQNGVITALSNGTTIITAQASKNNTTESSECEVTIKSPPSGYSISVQQIGTESYAYVYITPYDDNITNIQIYGKAPSGKISIPKIDENNFYSFNECGIWTIYASIENDVGIYEAHKPEDFATIEVTNVTNISDDSIKMYNNLIQQLIP